MINIQVHANLKTENNEMRLEDMVNTTTFIYSRIKYLNMEYDEANKEMQFYMEYETADNEFLRLEDIINTNNILGSELTYLNIDSKNIADNKSVLKMPIDKVTIPEDADMELQEQTDYYVFAKNIDDEIKYWAGAENCGFRRWVTSPDKGKRFKTANACIEAYCRSCNISFRFVDSWDTINCDKPKSTPYMVWHIVDNMTKEIEYYERV